jgi:hypothetical protein
MTWIFTWRPEAAIPDDALARDWKDYECYGSPGPIDADAYESVKIPGLFYGITTFTHELVAPVCDSHRREFTRDFGIPDYAVEALDEYDICIYCEQESRKPPELAYGVLQDLTPPEYTKSVRQPKKKA